MTKTTLTDRIEPISDAVIQHGPLSNRIYLMSLGSESPAGIAAILQKMAKEQGYTKIFAKVRRDQAGAFLQQGYRIEASIPLFYGSKHEAVFLGKFLSPERSDLQQPEQIAACLRLAQSRTSQQRVPLAPPKGAIVRQCEPKDAMEMSRLYSSVFETYPFPIHDPGYIRATMQSHVKYFAVELSGQLIALSSAEMNSSERNVEMTDFATNPAWRGHGLATCLLVQMEQEMAKCGMATAYTIARALSPSMNISFAKTGYCYCGTLINNTNIAGHIESMNVWYKSLL